MVEDGKTRGEPEELGEVRKSLESAPAAAFEVGQRVEAKFRAQELGSFAAKWYGGVVSKVNAGGATFDVEYEDGDHEDAVPLKFLRQPRKSAKGGSAQKQEVPPTEPPKAAARSSAKAQSSTAAPIAKPRSLI